MAPDETNAQRDALENERSALGAERSREAAEHARSEANASTSRLARMRGALGRGASSVASAAWQNKHRVAPGKLLLFILAAGFVHWLDIRYFNFNPLDPTRFLFHFIIMLSGIFIFSTGNRKQDITRFLFLFFIIMFLGVITRGLHYFLLEAVFATSSEAARLILGTLLNSHLLPVWMIFAITQETVEQTWFTKVMLFAWIIILLLAFYSVVPNIPRSFADVNEWYASLPAEEREQTESFLERVGEGANRFYNDIMGGMRRAVVGQIQYAAGDYYTGRVDENREEPLGVYIENLQLASDIFYEDEPITVWGALKARTLDPNNPIDINISCSSTIGGTECGTRRVQGDVNPDPTLQGITYRIFGREYQDLSCEFPARTLSSGYRDIRFTAEFDFTTDAYLKIYFIDQDRSRALARANIDPFTEYSIQDRRPIAVYSNGPISIGAGTSEPLVALSPNRDFRFGITFNNRWQGKIKRLKTLVIKIPETMDLVRCDQQVTQRACEGNECEGGKYTRVWVLDLSSRQLTNITSARTFSCRVHTEDVQATLGGVPIATKYFKVRAEYVYEIEQRIGAQVRPVEGVDISCAAGTPGAIGAGTPSVRQTSAYDSISTPYSAVGEDDRIRNLIALYGPTVDEIRSRYPSVPRPLVYAVISASSVRSITHPSSVGLMGINPAHSSRPASELSNPEVSIDEGMSILSSLISRYGGDLRRVLVAYTVNPDDAWVGGSGDASYSRWASSGFACWSERCDGTSGARAILPNPKAQDFAARGTAYLQRADILIGQTGGAAS